MIPLLKTPQHQAQWSAIYVTLLFLNICLPVFHNPWVPRWIVQSKNADQSGDYSIKGQLNLLKFKLKYIYCL